MAPKGRLFPAFGDLNNVEEPVIGRTLDLKNTSVSNILRETALGVFKKDSFENNGPLKGIVLRVDLPSTNNNPDSWINRVFGSSGERPPPLKSLKVRIPEIHAALPEPSQYGDNAGNSNKVIDMYPSFLAISEEVSGKPVAPGDIVLVDFVNRVNLTQPLYLGPALAGTTGGAVGQKGAATMFKENSPSALGVAPPSGDNVLGNKDNNNQVPQALNGNADNSKPSFLGINSKPKARLIPLQMDVARTGFSKGQGFPVIQVREDIAQGFAEARRILNALGAVLVSAGSLRPLNADVTSGRVATSFHYTALAVDLWTQAGCYPDGNPNTDEYVIEYDRNNPGSNGPKFIVWARSNLAVGTSIQSDVGTFQVESKKLNALDVRRTTNKAPPEETKVEGNFVNLTSIMEANGFIRISGHKEFYTKSKPLTSEWWHFQAQPGLVPNQTTFKQVLDVVYDDHGEEPYKYGSYVWNGSFFKKA